MQVRPACLTDVPWIEGQLRELHAVSGQPADIYDEKHVLNTLPNLIEGHVFLVAEMDGGAPCGFICGMILSHYLWPKIVTLVELVYWVERAHRFGRAAEALLDRYVEVGKKYVNWVIFTVARFTPIKPESLQRRGFTLKDTNWVLEVV